jgi:plasmid stabilization system protein ParE
MAEREIVWTEDALLELKVALESFDARDTEKEAAKRFLANIHTTVLMINQFPKIGKLCDDEITRVFRFGPFLIFYAIDDEELTIYSLWHARQNPERRFDRQFRNPGKP